MTRSTLREPRSSISCNGRAVSGNGTIQIWPHGLTVINNQGTHYRARKECFLGPVGPGGPQKLNSLCMATGGHLQSQIPDIRRTMDGRLRELVSGTSRTHQRRLRGLENGRRLVAKPPAHKKEFTPHRRAMEEH